MTVMKHSGKNLERDPGRPQNGPAGKARVLRIIARLILGGPARQVLLLNSELDRETFTSYLATGTVSVGEHDMKHAAEELGIELYVIDEMQREISPFRDIVSLFKLCALMRRLKPHIVHTHTAKAGTLGRIAAFLTGVPVRIHTFHGHVFHSYFGMLKTRFIISVEKALAGLTDKIVVISPAQMGDVRDKYRIAGGDKLSLIPLGLDIEPFLRIGPGPDRERGIRRELGIASDETVVCIIGRLVGIKDHRMFLEAASMVKAACPGRRLRFLVVGDGALRNDLEKYARSLGLADSAIFTGWRTDLAGVYSDIDIVCLTSLNEGTPISIIEALASARPVVSTDVGGVRDIVQHGETGFLSPVRDASAFASYVAELVNDAGRREDMGKKGRAFVSRVFSKERLIGDIERLYSGELLKKGIAV